MVPCCHKLSGACFKPLRFTKSSQKNVKKSRNSRFPISSVRKLLSEVEPYRTINNEVDVAKKCYQVWQKVAKGVLRGSQGLQGHGIPRRSKGSDDRDHRVGALRLGTYARAPYAFAALGCRPKAGRLVRYKINTFVLG